MADHMTRGAIADEFDEAIEFSVETRAELNEKEQYYADRLVEQGFEVRFNDLHILNRKGIQGTVLTYLRSNLKMN